MNTAAAADSGAAGPSLTLRHERDDRGIISLWVDQPQKPVVVLDSWLLRQVDAFFDFLDRVDWEVRGFILHSASDRVFIAGADLVEIASLDDAGLDAYLALGQRVFNRIEAMNVPTVACISGDTLGGGLEIALCCKYRVAVQPTDRVYQIGLPEAKLGLVPGWGGTQRLPAVVRPGVAIGRTMTGRTFTPAQALRHGLVDRLTQRDQLHAAAVELIEADPAPDRPRTIQHPAAAAAVRAALPWARSIENRPLRRLPAARSVVECVQVGLEQGLEAGLKHEREALVRLRSTEESKGLLGSFFARGSVLKGIQKGLKQPAAPADKIAVLGEGGPIGAALVKRLGKKAQVTRISPADQQVEADVFIAATEDDRVEHMAALRAMSAIAKDDDVIVFTLSTVGIDDVAASVTHPERIVGILPGRPAASPVVQIVRGLATSEAALGAACTIVRHLGGIPVLQWNGGPSLLTRLFSGIAQRALEIVRETGDPAALDREARQEGVAMGPFEIIDAIGMETVARLGGSAIPAEFATVKTVYADRARRQVSPAFAERCSGAGAGRGSAGKIEGYWVDALIEGANAAVQAGVVNDPETLWLAATFGLGLGPWRRDWLARVRMG